MSKKLENIKLLISESMGVCPTHITMLVTFGEGVLLQFHEDVRGGFVIDHEDNEYVYLHSAYGYSEVYDFIEAENRDKAIFKMTLLTHRLNKELEIEKGA
jgi:hypothetical protein